MRIPVNPCVPSSSPVQGSKYRLELIVRFEDFLGIVNLTSIDYKNVIHTDPYVAADGFRATLCQTSKLLARSNR